MRLFNYKARDGQGNSRKGRISADGPDQAVRKLKSNRLYPLRIKEVRPGKKGRIPLEAQALFFEDLAGLLKSGAPMDRALALVIANQRDKALRLAAQDMLEAVRKGDDFSGALGRNSQAFAPMTQQLVRAGEAGGELAGSLQRLSAFMTEENEFRRKLISALIYPCLLLSMSGVTIAALLVFVIPRFAQIFSDLNQPPPASAAFLFRLGQGLNQYWPWILISALIAVMALRKILALNKIRQGADRLLLALPVIKGLVMSRDLSRCLGALGALLRGGAPMLAALRLSEEAAANRIIRKELSCLAHEVKSGQSVSSFFTRRGFFPSRVGAMLAIYEEQGELSQGLIKLGERYGQDFQLKLKRFSTLIEPAAVIATGLVVGGAVLVMFSAIFGIADIEI